MDAKCECCTQPAQLSLTLRLGTNEVAALPLCHRHALRMQLGEWRLSLFGEDRAVDICGWKLARWAQDG